MKALDKIEPRVCVNMLPGDVDAVHVISASGNYYLTADITGEPGKHGIRIDADDVSIDLNGFSMTGVPGSLDGLHALTGRLRVEVVGGVVRYVRDGVGFSSRIEGFDGDGVHIAGASTVSLAGLALESNGGDGAEVHSESLSGEDVMVVFSSCIARGNGGNGVSVTNGRDGGGAVFSCKIDCFSVLSCMNGGDGVQIVDAPHIRLEDVDSLENGDDGIDVTVTARAANEGFFDIVRGQSIGNIGHGVSARAGVTEAGTPAIDKCFWSQVTVCGNGLDGFHDENAVSARWEECSSAKNGGVGYYKIFQPGQPSYGNISMDRCSGTENGGGGAVLLVPMDADFSIDASACTFTGNVSNDGTPVHGLSIDTSGGVPDPAQVRGLAVNVEDTECGGNGGEGLRVKNHHQAMMATIGNVRARTNAGSGIDIGPGDGAVFFDIVVNFEDIFCSANSGNGASVSGGGTVTGSTFSGNGIVGLAISGFPGSGLHVNRTTADGNGGDGISIIGGTGGSVLDCIASNNVGTGIFVGSSGIPGELPATGMRIDQCFASFNSTGIAVEGENVLLRSGGSHNTLANMALGVDVFAGPSVASPAWVENKPYSWP